MIQEYNYEIHSLESTEGSFKHIEINPHIELKSSDIREAYFRTPLYENDLDYRAKQKNERENLKTDQKQLNSINITHNPLYVDMELPQGESTKEH